MRQTITDRINAAGQAASLAKYLADQMGATRFKTWFGRPENICLTERALVVKVPNTFAANWIQAHYLDLIEAAAQSVLGHKPQLEFVIDPQGGHPRNEARPPIQPARAAAAPQRQAPTLTLDNFVVGRSNELAFNAAKAILQEGPRPFNPLFVHGGCGVGKTHLLHGICHQLDKVRPGCAWLYTSAEQFANQFITALKNKRLEEFRKRIRQLELLAIDDIHFLANKPSTQEEFFHTFDTISMAGRQVVMASDAPPRQIRQLSDKLVNRFVSGMVVRIDPPDLQMRYQICRQYVHRLAGSSIAGRPSHKVPEAVIRYLAEHVTANVRELEGALVRVLAVASLQRIPITLDLARQAVSDLVTAASNRPVDLERIQQAVSSYFGIEPDALRSASRDRTVALARQICMYLAREDARLSCTAVGRYFGNRHHATVLAAQRKIGLAVSRDAELHWQGPTGYCMARAEGLIDVLKAQIRG